MKEFVANLDSPLGIGQCPDQRQLVRKMMNDKCMLEIPVNDGRMVNIVHVATALAKRLAKEVSAC